MTIRSLRTRVPPVDGAAVAAAFADNGGGLAGDGGFIHGGDALDDFAVGGDDIARGADEAFVELQFVAGQP